MTCADIEALVCDYVEGALAEPQLELVERHLGECPACACLVQDVRAAVLFMRRATAIEPPPELVTRILFQIPTRAASRTPAGAGLRAWCASWLRPLIQPRFAMGMAMTILSFSMLGRFAGVGPRQLDPADLHPIRLWQALDDSAHRAWDRARKFYLSLRVVYEIQTQLREWSQQLQEEPLIRAPDQPSEAPDAIPPAPSRERGPKPGPGENNASKGETKP